MAWYLKFPADTGTAAGNNKLIQVSAISTTGNVNVAITYAENAVDPSTTAVKSAYLLDKRRVLNNNSTNGGGGYLFENNNSINSVETSNYLLNGAASNSGAWRTALADQTYSFDIGSTGDGVIAIGARFSQTDSFPLFAVKTIVITDSRGAHTIDMSASNGTSNEFTSTDGLVSLRLFGFTDNSHWIFYSSGTAYTDTLQQGTYTSSGGVLASFRGVGDTLNGGSYTSAGSTLAATQGYSSQLNGTSYTSVGGQLSSSLGFSSTLQDATFTSSGGQLTSTRGYGDTLAGGSYSYAGGILVSTVSGAAQSYVDVLLGGSYASTGASLASSRGYSSQLQGGNYASNGGSLSAFYGYSSTLNGGSYAYAGNRLISTWSGEVTVTIEGYTIRFADDQISAKFHADDVSANFDNDHVSVTWRH